ncbi:MAG: alanine racemase [Thermodesulfobacteriota bacterium]|nr:alanine racemase [Thermodesulfobacteriota bacterium]
MNDFSAWAEIDLDAVAHNVAALKALTRPACRLMAAVKADGYGHGMCKVAAVALESGASALGVSRIDEALDLRNHGITAPILVLGHTPAHRCREMVDRNLIQTVCALAEAQALSRAATAIGATVSIHLKVDTGMGRLGINTVVPGRTAPLEAAVKDALAVLDLPGLAAEGVFTHFACADSADKTHANAQFERFSALIKELEAAGRPVAVRHAANSAALIDMPETHLDMVRAGIAIYGLYPSAEVNRQKVFLKPAMAFKTRVAQVKKVPAGFTVSYGATYTVPAPTTLAVVSVGYADGLNRLLSSRGFMLVRGCRVPVVGRICMDLTMLDVGGVPDVAVGDEVVIFGSQDGAFIGADEIADALNTISYEVVTSITGRVPRVYVNGSSSDARR